MIVKSVPFDETKDVAVVEQSGFLDLQEAWVNKVVPGDISSSALDYNGIEEPDAILGKPRDFADAYTMAKNLENANYERSENESQ